MSAPLPWVGLAGPTASGKTAAALAVAAHLTPQRRVEIVSVDSALVYRGMDIGTAKPDTAERAAVPHHLIDIRDPRDSYSAAAFTADAQRLIGEIHARGALPLLVGGTMLYFKALIDGLDAMPAADPTVRARIDAEAAALGWPALHARLAVIDPVTAARLAPHDSQRIQRALEVWHSSGWPISAFQQRSAAPADAMKRGAAHADGAGAATLFSLEPQDRAWLHARIARRFDAMLAAGFLDEVRALRARGDLGADLPAIRCVGYRQAWEMFDALNGCAPDAAALAALHARGVAATRQLAKRQLTWLRGMPRRRVIACDAPDALAQTVEQVARTIRALA